MTNKYYMYEIHPQHGGYLVKCAYRGENDRYEHDNYAFTEIKEATAFVTNKEVERLRYDAQAAAE